MRMNRRGRAVSLRASLVCVALALLVFGAARGWAQGESDAGQAAAAHKAAYLRHIAELTTWPDGSFGHGKAPIVIGVLGEDASGVVAALERRIRGKGLSAQNRPVELRRLDAEGELAFQLEGCHLLFVPDSQGQYWQQLRGLLSDRSIVTVSDTEGFSRAHGMIEFVFDRAESSVSMHIDLVAVHRARLRLSSKLLGLKRGVKIVRSPGEGEA
jgi:hypothetical protein